MSAYSSLPVNAIEALDDSGSPSLARFSRYEEVTLLFSQPIKFVGKHKFQEFLNSKRIIDESISQFSCIDGSHG